MKRLKKTFTLLLTSLALLFIGILNGVKVNAATKNVTYTVTSKTAVSAKNAPAGTSATYTQTYGTVKQMTSGNSVSLTLSGYAGYTIKGLTLSMRSNKSSGAGTLSAKCGDISFASITDSSFDSENWYGAYTTTYVNVEISVAEVTVGESENIVISLEATANSLYVESYTLSFDDGNAEVSVTGVSLSDNAASLDLNETKSLTATVAPSNATNTNILWASSDESVATVSNSGLVTAVADGTTTITVTTEDGSFTDTCEVTVAATPETLFKSVTLQKQLVFSYSYDSAYTQVDNPVVDTSYYFGLVNNNQISFAGAAASSLSTTSTAVSYQLKDAGTDQYYIYDSSNEKYIGYKSGTDLKTATSIPSDDTANSFMWTYIDGAWVNVGTNTRYLGLADNKKDIKSYATSNKATYLPVQFYNNDSSVTTTDMALRIGFSVPKTTYDKIIAKDSQATFGIYLEKTNKDYECTIVDEGDSYRFFVSISGIPEANYGTTINSYAYVYMNSVRTLNTSKLATSVKKAANEYLAAYVANPSDYPAVAESLYALSYIGSVK